MIKIIPEVKKLEIENKEINIEGIVILGDISAFSKKELENFIAKKTKYKIDSNGYQIIFGIKGNANAEWYQIEMTENQMSVFAASEEGIFRAVQTIKQILCQKLYVLKIEDEPANNFRAFMLDVGRYFYPLEDVKTIVDYIALYKFNYFHIHLTEDQGWRFESKLYPKLTIKGCKRSHTNFGFKKEEGFYTQEQLKELVDYCHKRYIKVIPEIDMPGHTMSALACYPELSCFDRKLKVSTHWGIKFDIMCAGKDFTYKFCKDIIDELCEIFTDEYIHIGGDEALKLRWSMCEHCKKKLAELELDNMEQLQIYFANYMADYIAQKGKKTIMWYNKYNEKDKIVPNNDIIVQFWGTRKDKEFCKVVESGRKVITSNSSGYYIDLPYGYITLSDSYNTQGITGLENAGKLFGYETCLWTEYVKDIEKAKFNMFPRVFAISEIFWSGEGKRDYNKFLEKLPFNVDFVAKFGVKVPRKGIYNPNKIRKFFSKLWFEKRQLVWQGLYLTVDNFLLKQKIKRKNKK